MLLLEDNVKIRHRLVESASGPMIGYWMIPDGDTYVKLPIHQSYQVERYQPGIRTLWMGRGNEEVKIQQRGLLLPVWPLVVHWKALGGHLPWLPDMIYQLREGLFKPGTDECLKACQSLQTSLFGQKWSFFVLASPSTGLFGTKGGKGQLPHYWDEFVSELEGNKVQEPQHIKLQTDDVEKVGFVDSTGDCYQFHSLKNLVSSQTFGLKVFLDRFEDGPEWDNLLQAYQQGILNDPNDFRGIDQGILQSLFNTSSYNAALISSKSDPKTQEVIQRVLKWFSVFADTNGLSWFNPSDFLSDNDQPSSANVLDDVLKLIDNGSLHSPAQIGQMLGQLRGMLYNPIQVNQAFAQMGPKDEENLVRFLHLVNQYDQRRDIPWLKLDRIDAWKQRDQIWQPRQQTVATITKNNLTGNRELLVGRVVRHLQNGGSATLKRAGANGFYHLLARGPKDLLLPDGTKVDLTAELKAGAEVDLLSQLRESQELNEVTLKRMLDLTSANGRYLHGGLVRVGGVWLYDPSVRGRRENSRFVFTGRPRIRWAPDGVATLRFSVKTRTTRCTTGEWQSGFIQFKRKKRGIMAMVATAGEPWRTAFDASDVECQCTCPDFRYRWHYALAQKGVAPQPIGAGNAPPVRTNPLQQLSLCKHLAAIADMCSDTAFQKANFGDRLFKKTDTPDPPDSARERSRRRTTKL
jgi:hypothetical protein